MVLKKSFLRISMWNSRPPPPFMEKSILNFHFDHLHPSLTWLGDSGRCKWRPVGQNSSFPGLLWWSLQLRRRVSEYPGRKMIKSVKPLQIGSRSKQTISSHSRRPKTKATAEACRLQGLFFCLPRWKHLATFTPKQCRIKTINVPALFFIWQFFYCP